MLQNISTVNYTLTEKNKLAVDVDLYNRRTIMWQLCVKGHGDNT